MAAWRPWVLSGSGTPPVGVAGAVGVVSWQPGRFDIFVRGCDQALWHAAYTGTWNAWENLGGVLTASPAAVSWASGRIDVVVRGTNGALFHKFFQAGWSGWESLGGQLMDGTPALTSWGVNRLDVFVVGTNQAIWHKWFDGFTWHDWEDLAGTVQGTPGCVAQLNSRIDVFAIATNNTLAHKTYTLAGGWSAFGTPIPGTWELGVGATMRIAANQLDVFGVSPTGVLQHAWTLNAGASYLTETLDGVLVSSIGAVTDDGNVDLDLYAVGVDGLIYQKSFR